MRQECHSRSRSLGGTLRVLMGIGELKNEQKTGWQKKKNNGRGNSRYHAGISDRIRERICFLLLWRILSCADIKEIRAERRINRAVIPLESRDKATRQKNSFATFIVTCVKY